MLTASSQGSADKAVAQLKEKYPDATVAGISPNLSNLDSVRNAFREAASKYGCIEDVYKRQGYAFLGWFTQETGGTQIDGNTVFKEVASTTYYAHWEEATDVYKRQE